MTQSRLHLPADFEILLTLNGPFTEDGGYAVYVALPAALQGETDNDTAPRRCTLLMIEDGEPLSVVHAPHGKIRELGGGRYSFWKQWVWFSSSDQTDPSQNGRRYQIARAHPQPLTSVPTAQRGAAQRSAWTPPAIPVRVGVIGVGQRGASFIRHLTSLEGVTIDWLADSSAERANECRDAFSLSAARVSQHWQSVIADVSTDAVFVALPDHLHAEVGIAAFQAGKDVYLEEPIATNASGAFALAEAWRKSGRTLQIGYILRSSGFYAAIKETIRSGVLGPVRTILLAEQLGMQDGASFMRRWHRQSNKSGGMMVHNGSHDLDLACWLFDTTASSVTSFGSHDTFNREAPAQFCTQCGERKICPFVDIGANEFRTAAEVSNPSAYGLDRCVYAADADIVDNQIVLFELANSVRGTFHLNVQGTGGSRRTISIIGDKGRLSGGLEDNSFAVDFNDGRPRTMWRPEEAPLDGHGAGDRPSIVAFLNACLGRVNLDLTGANALAGLLLALAAEKARLTGTVVKLGTEK